MIKPKCAWIDICGELNVLFAMELRQRGIQLDTRSTLEEFLQEFNLNDYPVLLYHPGIKEQHRLKEVIESYPNTKVALITAPCSGSDYKKIQSDIPTFAYEVDYVEQFIRDNQ
jgi:hypothetical protein